jgi:hypothetical protein
MNAQDQDILKIPFSKDKNAAQGLVKTLLNGRFVTNKRRTG